MIRTHTQAIDEALTEISSRHREARSMLDIGCGDGRRTLLFADDKRELVGVDREDWLAAEARQRIRFQRADFMEAPLPFADASFPLVFCFDVIEHLRDPSPLLREARRVLTPAGTFVLGTPNRHRILGFLLLALGLRRFPYAPDPAHVGSPYSMHETEYTVGQLTRLAGRFGLLAEGTHLLFYGKSGGKGLARCLNLPFAHNIILELGKTHPQDRRQA